MIVVSDTGPINYLILIGEIELLPKLFGSIIIPTAVHSELLEEKTPAVVRDWLRSVPKWFAVQGPKQALSASHLGQGESEAITLALELKADEILVDDRVARKVAASYGLTVTGTLGVLLEASDMGLVSLPDALDKLRRTNFRITDEVVQAILRKN